jgi:RimJ/RimL family protein N-acetyltransferase
MTNPKNHGFNDGSPLPSIRPVSAADLPELLQVYRQCEDFLALGPDPRASAEMILKDLELSASQGGVFCGIYLEGDELVGVLDYIPAGFEGDPALAFIELLMISRPYRGGGLGAQIVEMVENAIWEDPAVKTIVLGVQVNNPQAARFWQRKGYIIVSGPELLPDGTVCWRMEKTVLRDFD